MVKMVNKLFPTDETIEQETTYNRNIIEESAKRIDDLIDQIPDNFTTFNQEYTINNETVSIKELIDLARSEYDNADDIIKAFVLSYNDLLKLEDKYLELWAKWKMTEDITDPMKQARFFVQSLIHTIGYSGGLTDWRIREAQAIKTYLDELKNSDSDKHSKIIDHINNFDNSALIKLNTAYNKYSEHTNDEAAKLAKLKTEASLEIYDTAGDVARIRILKQIATCLKEVQLAEDIQVVDILQTFTSIFDTRQKMLNLSSDIRENSLDLPSNPGNIGKNLWNLLYEDEKIELKSFINDSIVQLWPEFIQKQLLEFINIIEIPVQNVISLALSENTQTESVTLHLDYEKYSSFLTEILQFLASVDLFKQFNNRLNDHVLYYNKHIDQNDTLALVTKASIITTSQALQDQINNSETLGYAETNAIVSLLKSLKELNDNIVASNNVGIFSAQQQKYQLLTKLTEELDIAIKQDSELFITLFNAICPNMLKIQKELDVKIAIEANKKDAEEKYYSELGFFITEFIEALSSIKSNFNKDKDKNPLIACITKFFTYYFNDYQALQFLEKLESKKTIAENSAFSEISFENMLANEATQLSLGDYDASSGSFISYYTKLNNSLSEKNLSDTEKNAIIKSNLVLLDFAIKRKELLEVVIKRIKARLFIAQYEALLNSIYNTKDPTLAKIIAQFIMNNYLDETSCLPLPSIEGVSDAELSEIIFTDNFDTDLLNILEQLEIDCNNLDTNSLEIDKGSKAAFDTIFLEDQLLSDIREIDINRDFYYSVPVENSLAIDFNESDPELNTLMNPHLFYDVNNVNNSFVVSKLDIEFLSKGIQIARSSKLN